MNEKRIETGQLLRFVIPSAIGVFLFLCPIWYNGAMNTPIGVLSSAISNLIAPISRILVCMLVVISAVGTLINTCFKPGFVQKSTFLKELFETTPIYMIIRVGGAIVTVMVFLNVGPEWILSDDTGNTMMGLMATLIAWFFAASFLIQLLMDYGIMDFVGILLRNFLRPLFKLPGRASVDLLTSWIGNCNVGVVLTAKQYETGYYTAREAILIATCFSATSLPFCLVIAAIMDVDGYFIQMYLILTLVGVIAAMIMARIWPFRGKFKDEYYEPVGKAIDEDDDGDIKRTKLAVMRAVEKAAQGPNLTVFISKGVKLFCNIIITLVPVAMCIGTLACAVSIYTPVFEWLSMPFKWYFELLGVEEAGAAAPGAIVGFIDIFLPVLICSGITSIKTRFIITIITLVQIIYMTEVGSIMITSKMPVKVTDLAIIFLEKTVIAIPLIVLFTNLFTNF